MSVNGMYPGAILLHQDVDSDFSGLVSLHGGLSMDTTVPGLESSQHGYCSLMMSALSIFWNLWFGISFCSQLQTKIQFLHTVSMNICTTYLLNRDSYTTEPRILLAPGNQLTPKVHADATVRCYLMCHTSSGHKSSSLKDVTMFSLSASSLPAFSLPPA